MDARSMPSQKCTGILPTMSGDGRLSEQLLSAQRSEDHLQEMPWLGHLHAWKSKICVRHLQEQTYPDRCTEVSALKIRVRIKRRRHVGQNRKQTWFDERWLRLTEIRGNSSSISEDIYRNLTSLETNPPNTHTKSGDRSTTYSHKVWG